MQKGMVAAGFGKSVENFLAWTNVSSKNTKIMGEEIRNYRQERVSLSVGISKEI